MANTVRSSISIPVALKKRMDKVKEPVNWSSVACLAFEVKLAELASKREAKSMADTIERLLGTKHEHELAGHRAGFLAGRRWAEKSASYTQLRRLAKYRDRLDDDDWEAGFDDASRNSAFSAAEWLGMQIDSSEEEQSREVGTEFWSNAGFDVKEVDGLFAHGFADGALEVWAKVKDEL